MRNEFHSSSDTIAPIASQAAPRWSGLLIVAYIAHLAEEWWGGPGFLVWSQNTLGADISAYRFLVINGIALSLFTGGLIGAVRVIRLAWIAAAIAALLFLNGALHLFATLAFATYSPGTFTGVMLYLPLGGITLYAMSKSLPNPEYRRAIISGIVAHALIAVVAFS